MEEKFCQKCQTEKPLFEYYKNKTRDDGLQCYCKACCKNFSDKYFQENKEAIREHSRKMSKLPAQIASSTKARKKLTKERPHVVKAQTKLNYAVKKGLVIRPGNCENCGDVARVHGHHNDYCKPLEVKWLCPTCHRLEHKK